MRIMRIMRIMRARRVTALLLLPLLPGSLAIAAAAAAAGGSPTPRLAGESGVDEATAVTIDRAGNILVAGFSEDAATGCDYVTIKYSPDGQPLWEQRYAGAGGAENKPVAITADAAGNVYVTGSSGSGSGGGGRDIATVKYAPDGRQLWAQRYHGPASGDNTPVGIARDGSGSVYVAGTSRGTDTGFDYVTIKYSPEGRAVWTQRYNGEGNSDDRAAALAVDPAGNVCVTGSSHTSAHNFDYLTVKYSPEGKRLWTARYNGPHSGTDRAAALALDAAGEVYVTGTSNDGHRDGFLTVKYAADGREVWNRRFHGPTQQSDSAVGLGVDGKGAVYVAGASHGGTGTGYDYLVLKYAADGQPLWMRRCGGTGGDRPVAMDVSREGVVTVTGDSYGNGGSGSDFLTVQWDTEGAPLWSDRYDGPGHDLDRPTGLARDAQGNVVVAGYSWGGSASRFDFTTIRYDRAGRRQWVRSYAGGTPAAAAPAGRQRGRDDRPRS